MSKSQKKIQDDKAYVICGPEMNIHTTSSYSAHSFSALNLDDVWDFGKFKEAFRIEITKLTEDVLELDLVGIHPSIANGLRRIMISEVPTMAIEHVFFVDNTGIVQDEILAHRLGLIPIKADPSAFEWKQENSVSNERNCVVFKLDVACEGIRGKITDGKVLSEALEWLPNGSEMPDETNCRFATNPSETLRTRRGELFTPQPVHKDILLTKLQTRQAIQLEAHCFKGIGKDHAKWSPVATTWYRLRPEVVLLKEVTGDKAHFLASQFPGLFTVDKKPGTQKDIAQVHETRGHEVYLEQIRRLSGEEEWEKKLQLRKQKDYFLFTIESVGQLSPEEIFEEALEILIHKCEKLINAL